jgi:hypothetical protein
MVTLIRQRMAVTAQYAERRSTARAHSLPILHPATLVHNPLPRILWFIPYELLSLSQPINPGPTAPPPIFNRLWVSKSASPSASPSPPASASIPPPA